MTLFHLIYNYFTNQYSHKHLLIFASIILLFVFYAKYTSVDDSNKWEPVIFEDDDGFNNKEVEVPEHKKIDWNTYDVMYADRNRRKELGGHGRPAELGYDINQTEVNNVLIECGYNGMLSDKIAYNRSIRDYRSDDCKLQRYYADLPKASVIVSFFDDRVSAVLRTIYSVINRTPFEILEEIIVIDDGSENEIYLKELTQYIDDHFNSHTVQLLVLPSVYGATICRQEAAQRANGAVLVFLEAGAEVGYNWLPPLLEPIQADYRICTSPITDHINPLKFAIKKNDILGRGSFDWNFEFKLIPMLEDDVDEPDDNFETPILTSSTYAISTKYFWEINGHQFWGVEQMEMSFKIWLCDGKILHVPCSRVATIRKLPKYVDSSTYNVVYLNQKRLLELWVNEYKQYFYKKDPKRWSNLIVDKPNSRDITQRKSCKSFRYFIEEVTPDLLEFSPIVERAVFASGMIRSIPMPQACISDLGFKIGRPIGVSKCAEDSEDEDAFNQHWELNGHNEIKSRKSSCLMRMSPKPDAYVIGVGCNKASPNQKWSYNVKTNQIYNEGPYGGCLEYKPKINKIIINKCSSSPFMEWEWEYVNSTALKRKDNLDYEDDEYGDNSDDQDNHKLLEPNDDDDDDY